MKTAGRRIFMGLFAWGIVLFPLSHAPAEEKEPFIFVMIEYTGGSFLKERGAVGEMNTHARRYIPQFLHWLNENKLLEAREKVEVMKFSDERIFQHPLLFITGHTDFDLDEKEKANLKKHLERGGFLYIEDCGGTAEELPVWGYFSKKIKKIVQDLFPEGKWKVLPKSHDIYRFPYEFPEGLPNIVGWDNDQSPDSPSKKRKAQGGEGFFYKDRMLSFYSDADTCCGWNWNGQGPWGDVPFKVGANVLTYALTH